MSFAVASVRNNFRSSVSSRILRQFTTPHLNINPTATATATASASAISHIRMSSTTPSSKPLYEWLVHIPDHPGALEKRLAVRPQHLANLKPDIDNGIVVFGGAQLSRQPQEGEAPDMVGSFMLFKAESEDKVREWIEKDAYTQGGAWDAKNAKIWPFRCAVRTAL